MHDDVFNLIETKVGGKKKPHHYLYFSSIQGFLK